MDLQVRFRERGLHVAQERERYDRVLESGEASVADNFEHRRFPRLGSASQGDAELSLPPSG
jgi:hypothetical protein